jgi:hypothetical protein
LYFKYMWYYIVYTCDAECTWKCGFRSIVSG